MFCVLLFFDAYVLYFCLVSIFLLKSFHKKKTLWFYDYVYFMKMHFFRIYWIHSWKTSISQLHFEHVDVSIHSYKFLWHVFISFILIKETNQHKWQRIDLLIFTKICRKKNMQKTKKNNVSKTLWDNRKDFLKHCCFDFFYVFSFFGFDHFFYVFEILSSSFIVFVFVCFVLNVFISFMIIKKTNQNKWILIDLVIITGTLFTIKLPI